MDPITINTTAKGQPLLVMGQTATEAVNGRGYTPFMLTALAVQVFSLCWPL